MPDLHKEREETWSRLTRETLTNEAPRNEEDIVRVYTPSAEIDEAQAVIKERYFDTHPAEEAVLA